MSMLSRIDDWLIEGPYQAVVDFSQRQPAWWGRQCSIGYAVMSVLCFLVSPDEVPWIRYSFLIAGGLMFARIWEVTSAQPIFAGMGRIRLLRLLLWLGLLLMLHGVSTRWRAQALALSVGQVCVLSVYYFAACKPPRPRAPRFNLAPGGAA